MERNIDNGDMGFKFQQGAKMFSRDILYKESLVVVKWDRWIRWKLLWGIPKGLCNEVEGLQEAKADSQVGSQT